LREGFEPEAKIHLEFIQEKLLKIEGKTYGAGSYNLACSYSLYNDPENAKKYLQIALESGYIPPYELVKDDTDFKNVKDLPWFQQILETIPKFE